MSSIKNQCVVTLCLGLSSLVAGLSMGWSSPNLQLFKSPETPLPCGPLSESKLSWVVSIMSVSGFAGSMIGGWLIDYKGRIWTIRVAAIPAIVSWIFVFFAQNESYLIISRFLVGLCNGFTLIACPIYLAEVTENRIRGIIGGFCVMNVHFGILIAFIVGHYFSYKTATIFFGTFPILFLVVTMYLPETPFYLIKQNRLQQAEQSLAFLRNLKHNSKNQNENYTVELETLKTHHSSINSAFESKTIAKIRYIPEWKEFVTPSAKTALFLAFTLVSLNQLSGSVIIMSYASIIFEESGSNFEPNISAIIVGSLQLFGAITIIFVVDRLGRRFLMMVSTIGTALGLTAMSCFTYIKSLGYDVTDYLWIPLGSVSFVVYIVSWGAVTLTFLLIAEILPDKIRSIGMSVSLLMLWLLAALTAKLFYVISTIIGMHGIMLFFASSCYIGAVIIFKYLPETKGKSLSEIQELLTKSINAN